MKEINAIRHWKNARVEELVKGRADVVREVLPCNTKNIS